MPPNPNAEVVIGSSRASSARSSANPNALSIDKIFGSSTSRASARSSVNNAVDSVDSPARTPAIQPPPMMHKWKATKGGTGFTVDKAVRNRTAAAVKAYKQQKAKITIEAARKQRNARQRQREAERAAARERRVAAQRQRQEREAERAAARERRVAAQQRKRQERGRPRSERARPPRRGPKHCANCRRRRCAGGGSRRRTCPRVAPCARRLRS